MPRARGRQQWRPLSISHDIAVRGISNRPEEAVAATSGNNFPSIHDGVTVFVETLYSMKYPHPIECYASDCVSSEAAVIFFVKPNTYTTDRSFSVPVLMCDFGDILEGTTEVMGSALMLPSGSVQAQQILFIRFGEELFSVVLWCSRQRSWSHVATYHNGPEKIRVLYRESQWNFSTIEFVNTHTTQFGGLTRLYRLGTAKLVSHDDFVFESIFTDPFGPALRGRASLLAREVIGDDNLCQESLKDSSDSTSTVKAPSVMPAAAASAGCSNTQMQRDQPPSSSSSYAYEYAVVGRADENTPISRPSSVQRAPSISPYAQQLQAHESPAHHIQTPLQRQMGYTCPPQYPWTPGYTPPGWPSYYAAYTPGAVQWPQTMMSPMEYPLTHTYGYAPVRGYTTPYTGRACTTSGSAGPNISRAYLHTVRETPQSPTVAARSIAREAIMKMPEQAKERTKSSQEYRTVLYDPYRDQDKASLRAVAPTLDTPQTFPVASPVQAAAEDANVSTYPTIQALAEAMRSKTVTPSVPRALAEMAASSVALPAVSAPSRPQMAPIGTARPQVNEPWETPQNLKDSVPDTQWRAKPVETIRIMCPALAGQYTRQNFEGPFFTNELFNPTAPVSTPQKPHDEKLDDWWWSGNKFARQEAFHQSLVAAEHSDGGLRTASPRKLASPLKVAVPRAATPRAASPRKAPESTASFDLGRLLIPVYENLASYVEGPLERRRDYWCQWVKPPEWCCDRSAEGSKSFFDEAWGDPPARIGRDARYRDMPRFGGFDGVSPRSRTSHRRMPFGRST
ncbi:hypothetical protein AMS68_004203 [Peltaster fructicola]|uniref:Uncharacterized protein n=1 Tax=Peltaster fructicola TaxID=286661 RepID=A0A6H0XVH1_9PEZI|nr:hypothetical protein AMS68_004203 [Peltaster fructicola]